MAIASHICVYFICSALCYGNLNSDQSRGLETRGELLFQVCLPLPPALIHFPPVFSAFPPSQLLTGNE